MKTVFLCVQINEALSTEPGLLFAWTNLQITMPILISLIGETALMQAI